MKKILILLLSLVLCICSIGFFACGTPACAHAWGEERITTKATKTSKGTKTLTCSLCQETKNEQFELVAPTATQTYAARQKVAEETVEGYDFNFSLGANLSVLGLGTDVKGNYAGKYRNDKTTNKETFLRSTSGALFFDETALSYASGDKKIRLDADSNGIVEKASIMSNNDDGFFINKTIVSLVDGIEVSNIKKVEIDQVETPYNFVATLDLGGNNSLLQKVTNLLGKFGTKVAFKNISFSNPAAVPIHFNVDDSGRLNDFEIELHVKINVKLINVDLFVTYQQKDANSTIPIPSLNGLSVETTKIQSDLSAINAAISAVKTSSTYSLDLLANNEFDPAWNKLATVDRYTARMYKNTVSSNVWFNHSYMYKAHHEEQGAENYKYTLGNITDGTTHLISRKGSNVITPVTGYTADTQFDYLVSPFNFTANNIDCISSAISGNTTVYKVHLNNQTALNVQDKIIDIINSNEAEGVVDVNNYIGGNVIIKKAAFVITVVNGKLSKMEIETDLKYNPIGGEFTDYNITLTNNLTLEVNNKLSEAESYEAPNKAAATLGIGGLKYIL